MRFGAGGADDGQQLLETLQDYPAIGFDVSQKGRGGAGAVDDGSGYKASIERLFSSCPVATGGLPVAWQMHGS